MRNTGYSIAGFRASSGELFPLTASPTPVFLPDPANERGTYIALVAVRCSTRARNWHREVNEHAKTDHHDEGDVNELHIALDAFSAPICC